MNIFTDALLAQNMADYMSDVAAGNSIIEKKLKNLDNLLPAIVVSYDRATNLAVVRPLIQVQLVTGDNLARNALVDIFVLALGGGGYVVNFPLKAGDLGWIEGADKDLSNFIESLKETQPASTTHHKFTSGRFVPDVFRKYTIDAEDAGAMVLQHVSSNSRIAIAEDAVRIVVGDTRVVIKNGTVDITTDSATINASTTTVNGDMIVNGSTSLNGPLASTGMASLNGGMESPSASINGRDFMNHNHPDSGDTAPHNTGGVN